MAESTTFSKLRQTRFGGEIFETSSFNNHHNFCVKDFQSYDSTAVTLTQITHYQFIHEDKSYTHHDFLRDIDLS